ncbi:NADH-quinone oxidoreductase subunit L [Candidatus Profftella armatura (Diaphorina cf. continua)]|uniref:NADH-quinone oxidoreductase subunit L n=1 Tax=Candidatus Profftella armatura (Diaphorina cf. continua) TaxID=2661583 RepID=A0A7R6VYM7_9PROT|nr:NADH-quinone oxidoreductase subunit L [Candidatus Profftella armatura (Diaphorina cf. continua)]BCG49537.1 NADH-quinone oxidoreductase subunit L [Candidatus Profftella armatura (Diaphorina cf. continua)]
MIKPLNPIFFLSPLIIILFGSIITGLFGTKFFNNLIGRKISHSITIFCILIAFFGSIITLKKIIINNFIYNYNLYTLLIFSDIKLEIGFLIDHLTVLMMCIITFISLIVHIYSIHYMKKDSGYNRFFSYISLFTFSMLLLVMSNNLFQLFLGWEMVGMVSYLLIGFWYDKPLAITANLKAFLINRIGDVGLILGICLLFNYIGSMNYIKIFSCSANIAYLNLPNTNCMLITIICICLFIGAIAKSAQFPLHTWLPDSMEGPTPASALIHAATMVTAGIFIITRMSPLFELSNTALSIILFIGAITAFFMGLLGIIQNDIKRIIAYSTLSQLGYMTVGLGASAYTISIFHLMTHAFFKALLFLAAGSIIINMKHNQDIRKMGGLYKYMPITCITSLIGLLSLVGAPFFSGFYSKDSIINATYFSQITGSKFAYFLLLISVFITSFYSFRMYFLIFFGKENFKNIKNFPIKKKPNELSFSILFSLIILSIPSILIGFFSIKKFLCKSFFKNIIVINQSHYALEKLRNEYQSPLKMVFQSINNPILWLSIFGFISAYYIYIVNPKVRIIIKRYFYWFYILMDNQYYINKINEIIFIKNTYLFGNFLWNFIDKFLIDELIINNITKIIIKISKTIKFFQSGYLYHYIFTVIITFLGFLIYFIPFSINK